MHPSSDERFCRAGRTPLMNLLRNQSSTRSNPVRPHLRAISLAVLCLGVSGCKSSGWLKNGFKLGPNYETPFAAVGDGWIDNADPSVIAQPPRHAEWWKVFHDPVLNDLVKKAYKQNLTLREAGLRVLQARHRRRQSLSAVAAAIRRFCP
jgi:hypothetical protein